MRRQEVGEGGSLEGGSVEVASCSVVFCYAAACRCWCKRAVVLLSIFLCLWPCDSIAIESQSAMR